jgi:hypothetical protein
MSFIESLTAKTIDTGRTPDSYIDEAITALTKNHGSGFPNMYQIKSWLVGLHSMETTPSLEMIRAYLEGQRGIISEPLQNVWSSNATHDNHLHTGAQLPEGWEPYVKRSRPAYHKKSVK